MQNCDDVEWSPVKTEDERCDFGLELSELGRDMTCKVVGGTDKKSFE